MTSSARDVDLAVERIDQPRGDGLGRALVVESRPKGLSVILDDPGDVRALTQDLESGLAWLEEPAE